MPKVKGHRRGLTNIPGATGIWFCVQQRHPEPYTTCHLLISQTARPLLLGPRLGGREEVRWRVNGWQGEQVTRCSHLSMQRARHRTFIVRLQKPDCKFVIVSAHCLGPWQQVAGHRRRLLCHRQQNSWDKKHKLSTWWSGTGRGRISSWRTS